MLRVRGADSALVGEVEYIELSRPDLQWKDWARFRVAAEEETKKMGSSRKSGQA